MDVFIVDLQHANLYLILQLLVSVLLDSAEDFVASNRDDSFVLSVVHNAVTLAGACLTISEKASVVPVPCVVQHFLAQLVEHLLLVSVRTSGDWFEISVSLFSELVVRPIRVIECEVFFDSFGVPNGRLLPLHFDA